MSVLLVGESSRLGEPNRLVHEGVFSCGATEAELRRHLEVRVPAWLVLGYGQSEELLFRLFVVCQRTAPAVRLAVLGPAVDADRCRRWLRWGARAYLSSESNLARLLACMSAVDAWDVTVIEHSLGGSNTPAPDSGPTAALSARELEVLALVAEGLNNQEIAERLYITSRTVAFHVSNLMTKLDARNRTHAVEIARSLGL